MMATMKSDKPAFLAVVAMAVGLLGVAPRELAAREMQAASRNGPTSRGFVEARPTSRGLVGTRPSLAAGGQARAAAAAAQVTSRVTVRVPADDAELLVEGQPVEGTGISREFVTAPLDAGRTVEHRFTARWRPNTYTVLTRNKVVQFRTGDEVTVDLTKNDPNDRAQIRYVPTPADIAQEMIALARVTKDDVVYEPGCGDARIVIAAVKAGARKGVGIDIDPERVAESTANVNAENLEGKIEIRLADALEVDLSEATIVFLYMGNEFNLLIRPILWKQLPVGARVVSHRFTMGDWKPDQTAYVTGSGDELEYELHLWTITEAIKAQIEKASGF